MKYELMSIIMNMLIDKETNVTELSCQCWLVSPHLFNAHMVDHPPFIYFITSIPLTLSKGIYGVNKGVVLLKLSLYVGSEKDRS